MPLSQSALVPPRLVVQHHADQQFTGHCASSSCSCTAVVSLCGLGLCAKLTFASSVAALSLAAGPRIPASAHISLSAGLQAAHLSAVGASTPYPRPAEHQHGLSCVLHISHYVIQLLWALSGLPISEQQFPANHLVLSSATKATSSCSRSSCPLPDFYHGYSHYVSTACSPSLRIHRSALLPPSPASNRGKSPGFAVVDLVITDNHIFKSSCPAVGAAVHPTL